MSKGISKVGIQALGSTEDTIAQLSAADKEFLYNRRSVIEPLIGHVKPRRSIKKKPNEN